MTSNNRMKSLVDPCSCDKTSLVSLIFWNIAKAYTANPGINLRGALRETQERLASNRNDPKKIMSPEKDLHHLDCAFLAWQQLGHQEADSLHRFIKLHCPEDDFKSSKEKSAMQKLTSNDCLPVLMKIGRNKSMGPVITIPKQDRVVAKVVYNCYTRTRPKEIKNQVCCVEPEEVKRLKKIEATNRELRKRAATLARRESERIELLERAENAWRDLENGYERRLHTASAAERDLQSQIERLIEERNNYKKACTDMAEDLKKETAVAEKEKEALLRIEEQYHMNACARSCLTDEVAAIDDVLADHLCKIAQLDRDLQYRQEQTRCKKATLEDEVDTTRALTYETERLLHSELSNIKKQIEDISKEIVDAENENKSLLDQVGLINEEKNRILNDLQECHKKCDAAQKIQLDELKAKKQLLGQCEEEVLECRCKLPQDRQVEVKRTPSFVMCHCTPNRKLAVNSSSSVKSSMISDLLYELFDGLQSQLDDGGARMPCQLLKCLEDKHNWEKCSNLKTNVESYFDKLIKGELDILVTTFIAKYRSKWVIQPSPCSPVCQNYAMACPVSDDHTQRLAVQLADQILCGSAMPCCDSQTQKKPKLSKKDKAVYHCTVKTPLTAQVQQVNDKQVNKYWQRTQHKITHLRTQLNDLKKETIKVKEFNAIKDTINKLVQKTSSLGLCDKTQEMKKEIRCLRNIKDDSYKSSYPTKTKFEQKRITRDYPIQRKAFNNTSNLPIKPDDKQRIVKNKRYSVNVNMCHLENSPFQKTTHLNVKDKPALVDTSNNPQPAPDELLNKMKQGPIFIKSSTKQVVPVPNFTQDTTTETAGKPQITKCCPSQAYCFHKIPSSGSLDQFLETLKKWKYQLTESLEKTNKLQNQVQMLNKVTQFSDINLPINNTSVTENPPTIGSKLGQVSANVLQQIIHYDSSTPEVITSIGKCSNCFCETDEAFRSDNNGLDESKVSDYIGDINLEKSYDRIDKKNMGKKSLSSKSSQPKSEKNEKAKIFLPVQQIKGQNQCSIYDCNYKIKFLGATLSEDCDDYSKCHMKLNKPEKNYRESQSYSSASTPNHEVGTNLKYSNDNSSSKQKRTNNTNHSSPYNLDFNELENNVYDLLKDHLIRKIDNYMSKSLLISSKEKSILVSTILEKVKLTISQSTRNLHECMYQKETSTVDSWNRVSCLLQEYIKTKLKRADCICIRKGDQLDTKIMPDIIDKVSKLIDTDFEKLIQKFPMGTKSDTSPANLHTSENQSGTNIVFEIPEKDNSTIKSNPTIMHSMTSPISFSVEKFDDVKICTESTGLQAHSSIFAVNKQIEVDYKNSCKYLQTDSNLKDNCCYVVPSRRDFYGSCYNFSENKILPEQATEIELDKTTKSTNSCAVSCSVGEQFIIKPTTSAPKIISKTILKDVESKFSTKSKDISYHKMKIPKLDKNEKSFLGNPSKSTSFHAIYRNLKTAKSLNITQPLETLYCDTETNAVDEENITLKVSSVSLGNMNYESKIIGSDIDSHENDLIIPDFVANEYARKALNENESKRVSFKLHNKKRCQSEIQFSRLQKNNEFFDDDDENCDCNLVPICHVKMLMKNIEEKLSRSKCTCEVLSSDVCPIHSTARQ